MALWPDPDATTTAKGIVQLAGDLAGTATSPTVPGLTGKAASSHTHAESDVTSLVSDLAAKAMGLTATAVKTANYPAVAGDLVRADASGGTFTVTLPAATVGALIGIKKTDSTATAVSFAVTGGDTVDGVSSGSLVLSNQSRIFLGVSGGWTIPYGLNTLASQDTRYPLTSVLTTKGDEYVATASATLARLGVGTDGQVRVADSAQTSGQKWADGAPTSTATGTTGTTQGRFVGVTVSGAPASGTFSVGDFVVTQNGNMWVCTVAGTPGTWTNPTDTKSLMTTGEEVFDRMFLNNGACTYVQSTLRLTYFTARKTETTTQVRVMTGSTAAAATPTLCQIALYSVDASQNATLVANTANDTTLFASTNTVYTRSWASSYAKVSGQRYALAILVVSGAAAPSFTGFSFVNLTGAANELNAAPRLVGTLTGQATLPASYLESAITNSTPSNGRHWGVILP